MSWIKAVGRFCYDLIIGDDWKIAAAVVAALGVAAIGQRLGLPTQWWSILAAASVGAGFVVAILVDTRGR